MNEKNNKQIVTHLPSDDPFFTSMDKFFAFGTIVVSLLTVAIILLGVGDKLMSIDLKTGAWTLIASIVGAALYHVFGNLKK